MDSLSIKNERFLRQARKLMVQDEYAKGVPVETIAGKYGCAPSTVMKYARAGDLTRYANHDIIRPQVVAAYACGAPVSEICARFGIDRKSVWSWATRAGVPLRRPRDGSEAGDQGAP